MFNLIKKDGAARLGEFESVHGKFKTPCFMNVGTVGAIKGAVSSLDLTEVGCQVELCNTYHMHLKLGDLTVKKAGGLQKFMNWNGPILTDSGGFQVFSLSKTRTITEEGVHFSSIYDGRKIFIGPEQSMQIQSNLASTIAMAFDECVEYPSSDGYVEQSCARTVRWLERSLKQIQKLNSMPETLNRKQLLFGINQGLVNVKLRKQHMKQIVALNCDGYAIGGLSVGEPKEQMFEVIEQIEPLMPQNKIRYLMGVGKPEDILEAVDRGVDLFDCVMPSRNARHAHVFTWSGILNMLNLKYAEDFGPIDSECGCCVCKNFTRSYVRHLFKAKEALAGRLATLHNLFFYNELMVKIREAISKGAYSDFKRERLEVLSRRV